MWKYITKLQSLQWDYVLCYFNVKTITEKIKVELNEECHFA